MVVINGYTFDLLNWTGDINCNDCGSEGTNDGFVNNTGGSSIFTNNGQFGAGTSNTCIISGDMRLDLTFLNCPLNVTGGNIFVNFALFSQTVTCSGTSTGAFLLINSFPASGPAFDITSSGAITIENSTITTSNNPSIDGTGTVTVINTGFGDNANFASTLTVNTGSVFVDGTFSTLVPAAHLEMTATTLSASGSDANIGITISPKGTGTVSLANGTAGNNVSIGNGVNTVSQTINIANGASAANTTLNIMSGVGTAGAGVIAFGSNTRVTTIGIANIAPAAARTVTVQGGDSAQNDTLNVMSGNPSANVQTVTVLGGVPTGGTQVLNLLTQTGQAGTVNVGTGAAMANAINIGGTGANVIAIGNTQTAGSVAIGDAMTGGTISIGGTGAQTGTITISASTAAQTIAIANTNGLKTIGIGNGVDGNAITIGNGINTTAQTVTIAGGASGANSTVSILTGNGSAGTQTFNLMTGTRAGAVNIGTGAAAHVVTVGSTNGAASLTLQSGTGEITVTGTVKEINAEFLAASGDDITIQSSPVMTTAVNTGGAPTGATGDVNLMALQDGVIMEEFIIGAGQTIIAPRMDANGLLISLDLTAAEGAEYNFGAARTNSRHAFTIGTSAAFFFEIGLRINDMDGAAPYVIGFRKTEANNATFADYTDYATIGMIAASSATNVVLATELNAGGQTVTDTTDAWGGDGTTNTLKVLVSAAGVVTYTINGSAPSATAAFTFDNGDVVVPFIRITHSATPTAVNITTLKCGFQA